MKYTGMVNTLLIVIQEHIQLYGCIDWFLQKMDFLKRKKHQFHWLFSFFKYCELTISVCNINTIIFTSFTFHFISIIIDAWTFEIWVCIWALLTLQSKPCWSKNWICYDYENVHSYKHTNWKYYRHQTEYDFHVDSHARRFKLKLLKVNL